jgi:hypothetical protein
LSAARCGAFRIEERSLIRPCGKATPVTRRGSGRYSGVIGTGHFRMSSPLTMIRSTPLASFVAPMIGFGAAQGAAQTAPPCKVGVATRAFVPAELAWRREARAGHGDLVSRLSGRRREAATARPAGQSAVRWRECRRRCLARADASQIPADRIVARHRRDGRGPRLAGHRWHGRAISCGGQPPRQQCD